MNCAKHPVENDELMAYLDGELPLDRAAGVAAHLSQCVECQGLADEFRLLSQHLLAWQVEPCPERLSERVTAAVADREVKPTNTSTTLVQRVAAGIRQKLPRPWALGLAGASLVALILVLTSSNKRPTIVSTSRLESRTGAVEPYNAPAAGRRDLRRREFAGYDMLAKQKDMPLSSLDEKNARIIGGVGGGVAVAGALQAQNEIGAPGRLAESDEAPMSGPGAGVNSTQEAATGPMIIRRASLALVTKEFDKARTAVEQILRQHGGYIAQLTATGQPGSAHELYATLRVPSDQLQAAVAELKRLGRVTQESQAGDEVTQQYVDLSARLSNARTTEQRLIDVLQQRTGRVKDILAVEQEIARVRGEIEAMDAEKKRLENQVSFATLQLQVSEEYKAELKITPPSTGTLLHNTLVEGYRRVVDGVLDLVFTVCAYGPVLLFWILLLLWPARYLWRRLRPRLPSFGRAVAQ